ncbi:MAG: DUF4288 domain-containing protein [Bacteroidetes bacterium]|nr:DUF4288 domain-containing protein [Bacteroidota bacterium]
MQWFTACLVYAVEYPETQKKKWFEETWVMVPANSEKEALVNVDFHGNAQSEIFLNTHGEKISWKYLGHRHLQALASDNEIMEIVSLSKTQPGYFQKSKHELAFQG